MKYIKKYESNRTVSRENGYLLKYFYLESDDIKDWFQDLLDEYVYCDFKIEVVNRTFFSIYILDKNSVLSQKIGSLKMLSKDFIAYINNRLKEYDCIISKINLSAANQYIDITVSKIDEIGDIVPPKEYVHKN